MRATAAVMALAALVWGTAARAQDACAKLVSMKLPDTTVTGAQTIPAGESSVAAPFGQLRVNLPEHCRVTGSIKPTADSDIRFELWLPASGWNQRYQQVGNGGLAGSINHFGMVEPLQAGWAVASTDDGHATSETSGHFDGSWAAGHRDKLVDFGYRAVHLTALAGQAIVRTYYSRQAAHTYFTGCSDGGRESLMEAQRYPQDFDGYLVGAPGIDIPGNSLTHVHVWQVLHTLGPSEHFTPATLAALSAAVLERCDALDGVKDGVLRDPRRCGFKAAELVCDGNHKPGCLSAAQAEAVQKIYDGPRDSTTGAQLAPGAWGTLGTEQTTWPGLFLDTPAGPSLSSVANQGIIGALMYGNPRLDMATVNLASASQEIKVSLAPVINADNPDLSTARRMGRKILHYHGWADPNISPEFSTAYFESVRNLMGADTARFYRLFMVPGMAHCFGGVGPTYLGARGSEAGDPERDWLAALMLWVEKGMPPERLIATEYRVDHAGPMTPERIWVPAGTPVKSTRPLCSYPRVAVYRGAGSTADEVNFRCAAPPSE